MKKFIAVLMLSALFLPVLGNAGSMTNYIINGDSIGLKNQLEYDYINFDQPFDDIDSSLSDIEKYLSCDKYEADKCKTNVQNYIILEHPYYYQVKKEIDAIIRFFYAIKQRYPNPDKHLEIYGRFQNDILGMDPSDYFERIEFARQDRQ